MLTLPLLHSSASAGPPVDCGAPPADSSLSAADGSTFTAGWVARFETPGAVSGYLADASSTPASLDGDKYASLSGAEQAWLTGCLSTALSTLQQSRGITEDTPGTPGYAQSEQLLSAVLWHKAELQDAAGAAAQPSPAADPPAAAPAVPQAAGQTAQDVLAQSPPQLPAAAPAVPDVPLDPAVTPPSTPEAVLDALTTPLDSAGRGTAPGLLEAADTLRAAAGSVRALSAKAADLLDVPTARAALPPLTGLLEPGVEQALTLLAAEDSTLATESTAPVASALAASSTTRTFLVAGAPAARRGRTGALSSTGSSRYALTGPSPALAVPTVPAPVPSALPSTDDLPVVPAVTYRLCTDNPSKQYHACLPAPVAVPVPLDVDGDKVPDATVTLTPGAALVGLDPTAPLDSANPNLTFSIKRLTVPALPGAPTPATGPLPAFVRAEYAVPLLAKQIQVGFDGITGTLPDSATGVLTVEHVSKALMGDLQAHLAVDSAGPAKPAAVTFGVQDLTGTGGVAGSYANLTAGSLLFSPMISHLDADVHQPQHQAGKDSFTATLRTDQGGRATSLAFALRQDRDTTTAPETPTRTLTNGTIAVLPRNLKTLEMSRDGEVLQASYDADGAALGTADLAQSFQSDKNAHPGTGQLTRFAGTRLPSAATATLTGVARASVRASSGIGSVRFSRVTSTDDRTDLLVDGSASGLPSQAQVTADLASEDNLSATVEANGPTQALDVLYYDRLHQQTVARASVRDLPAAFAVTARPSTLAVDASASAPVGSFAAQFSRNGGSAPLLPGEHVSGVKRGRALGVSAALNGIKDAHVDPVTDSSLTLRAHGNGDGQPLTVFADLDTPDVAAYARLAHVPDDLDARVVLRKGSPVSGTGHLASGRTQDFATLLYTARSTGDVFYVDGTDLPATLDVTGQVNPLKLSYTGSARGGRATVLVHVTPQTRNSSNRTVDARVSTAVLPARFTADLDTSVGDPAASAQLALTADSAFADLLASLSNTGQLLQSPAGNHLLARVDRTTGDTQLSARVDALRTLTGTVTDGTHLDIAASGDGRRISSSELPAVVLFQLAGSDRAVVAAVGRVDGLPSGLHVTVDAAVGALPYAAGTATWDATGRTGLPGLLLHLASSRLANPVDLYVSARSVPPHVDASLNSRLNDPTADTDVSVRTGGGPLEGLTLRASNTGAFLAAPDSPHVWVTSDKHDGAVRLDAAVGTLTGASGTLTDAHVRVSAVATSPSPTSINALLVLGRAASDRRTLALASSLGALPSRLVVDYSRGRLHVEGPGARNLVASLACGDRLADVPAAPGPFYDQLSFRDGPGNCVANAPSVKATLGLTAVPDAIDLTLTDNFVVALNGATTAAADDRLRVDVRDDAVLLPRPTRITGALTHLPADTDATVDRIAFNDGTDRFAASAHVQLSRSTGSLDLSGYYGDKSVSVSASRIPAGSNTLALLVDKARALLRMDAELGGTVGAAAFTYASASRAAVNDLVVQLTEVPSSAHLSAGVVRDKTFACLPALDLRYAASGDSLGLRATGRAGGLFDFCGSPDAPADVNVEPFDLRASRLGHDTQAKIQDNAIQVTSVPSTALLSVSGTLFLDTVVDDYDETDHHFGGRVWVSSSLKTGGHLQAHGRVEVKNFTDFNVYLPHLGLTGHYGSFAIGDVRGRVRFDGLRYGRFLNLKVFGYVLSLPVVGFALPSFSVSGSSGFRAYATDWHNVLRFRGYGPIPAFGLDHRPTGIASTDGTDTLTVPGGAGPVLLAPNPYHLLPDVVLDAIVNKAWDSNAAQVYRILHGSSPFQAGSYRWTS